MYCGIQVKVSKTLARTWHDVSQPKCHACVDGRLDAGACGSHLYSKVPGQYLLLLQLFHRLSVGCVHACSKWRWIHFFSRTIYDTSFYGCMVVRRYERIYS